MAPGDPLVSDEDFVQALMIIFNCGTGSAANAGGNAFQRAEIDCKALRWGFNGDTADSYMPGLMQLIDIQMKYDDEMSGPEREKLIKIVLDRLLLVDAGVIDRMVEDIRLEVKALAPELRNLGWLQSRISDGLQKIIQARNDVRRVGDEPPPIKRDKRPPTDTQHKNPTTGGKPKTNTQSGKKPKGGAGNQPKLPWNQCTGCGRQGHKPADCSFKDHPDFNKDPNKAFADSKGGKFWANLKSTTIPWSIEPVANSEPHKAWKANHPDRPPKTQTGSGDSAKEVRYPLS
jgi:hypothetical protein